MPSTDAAAGANPVRMIGRPRKLSAAQDRAVAQARAAGVAWKTLQRQYQMGRTALWEAMRRGRVSEHLQGDAA